jgi:hypothetical protein
MTDDRQAPLYVTQSMWDELARDVREARKDTREARDVSRDVKHTLDLLVVPKLALVDQHEAAIQQLRGVLWAFGLAGSAIALGLTALSLWV